MIDNLHDALKAELETIFDGKTYKTPEKESSPGVTRKGLTIYPQYIPQGSYESEDDEFPYILLRTIDGTVPVASSEVDTKIKVMFLIGIYDDNQNYQGYRDILNIISKITTHFAQKPTVNQFELVDEMNWAANEDDIFPFFLGAIETHWSYMNVKLQSNEYV